jgi:hypothetical protein
VSAEIRNPDGSPAQGASVWLLPGNFNPALDSAPDSLHGISSITGQYTFHVSPGQYCLTAEENENSVALLKGPIVVEPSSQAIKLVADTLLPTGSITIALSNNSFSAGGVFYIPGTLHMVAIDAGSLTAQTVRITDLPPAILSICYQPPAAQATMLADTLTVAPAETVVAASALPLPWQAISIGETPYGGVLFREGKFTIAGGGPDIWNSVDGFFFVYRQCIGNDTLVTRLARTDSTAGFDKAGIMLRADLAPGSSYCALAFENATNGLLEAPGAVLFKRASPGDTSLSIATMNCRFPIWLSLRRSGNVCTGTISADGIVWQTVGSDSLALPDTLHAGICVSSHSSARLKTAVFDYCSLAN